MGFQFCYIFKYLPTMTVDRICFCLTEKNNNNRALCRLFHFATFSNKANKEPLLKLHPDKMNQRIAQKNYQGDLKMWPLLAQFLLNPLYTQVQQKCEVFFLSNKKKFVVADGNCFIFYILFKKKINHNLPFFKFRHLII